MSDLTKEVLNGTKRIEAALTEKFGATGRGLYEKMSTANMALPEHLQKRIRYVATLRNKTAHEDGFEIQNIPAYVKTCNDIVQELETLHANRKPASIKQGLFRQVALLLLASLGLVAFGWLAVATALHDAPTTGAKKTGSLNVPQIQSSPFA